MSTLDSAILPSLREVLMAAGDGAEARCFSLGHAVALSGVLPIDAGITVDFRSIPMLGYPLVMVRHTRPSPSSRFGGLTAREREVAACLAAGLSNRDIAARLCLSRATVKDHVHRILAKTGFENRTAVALAWRWHD